MSAYRTAIETNYRMIKGETITENERRGIVGELLGAAEAGPAMQPRDVSGIFYPPGGRETAKPDGADTEDKDTGREYV